MRLIFVFSAILALSLAESEHKTYDDLEAAESLELQRTDLKPEASVYNSVPYPSQQWNPPQNYVPQQTWPQPNPVQPPYVPPFTLKPPVQSDYVPPQNWNPPSYVPTTTTPVPVIKNEQWIGDNGNYKYEYQIADGTHVGEEGYFTNPKQDDESLVKKGWYSYQGADGKTYTVTYWADHTGFHAYGDHLPTPPPVPPAIQAAIDQNAKEEAAKAEAEKNKPYYPTTQRPVYYDPPQQSQNPTYYPAPPQNPIYNPPQQQNPTYYPQQQIPSQQNYYPSQTPQQYYPPQQNYPVGK